jgi:hypothetical protein
VRYYGPALGRFLQPDPSLKESTLSYVYVSDDPVDATDTSGLCFIFGSTPCHDLLGQAVGGAFNRLGTSISKAMTIPPDVLPAVQQAALATLAAGDRSNQILGLVGLSGVASFQVGDRFLGAVAWGDSEAGEGVGLNPAEGDSVSLFLARTL